MTDLASIPITVFPYLPQTIRDRHGDEYNLLGVMVGAGGKHTLLLGDLVRQATAEEKERIAKAMEAT